MLTDMTNPGPTATIILWNTVEESTSKRHGRKEKVRPKSSGMVYQQYPATGDVFLVCIDESPQTRHGTGYSKKQQGRGSGLRLGTAVYRQVI